MNSLPNDILRYIALRLDPKSLYVYMLLSRKILTANTIQIPALHRLHLETVKLTSSLRINGTVITVFTRPRPPSIDAHFTCVSTTYRVVCPNGHRYGIERTFGDVVPIIVEDMWNCDIRGSHRLWISSHGDEWKCAHYAVVGKSRKTGPTDACE